MILWMIHDVNQNNPFKSLFEILAPAVWHWNPVQTYSKGGIIKKSNQSDTKTKHGPSIQKSSLNLWSNATTAASCQYSCEWAPFMLPNEIKTEVIYQHRLHLSSMEDQWLTWTLFYEGQTATRTSDSSHIQCSRGDLSPRIILQFNTRSAVIFNFLPHRDGWLVAAPNWFSGLGLSRWIHQELYRSHAPIVWSSSVRLVV